MIFARRFLRTLGFRSDQIIVLILLASFGVSANAQPELSPIDPAKEILENLAVEDQERRIEEARGGISIQPRKVAVDLTEECVDINNIRILGTSIDHSGDNLLHRKRPIFDSKGELVSDGLLPPGAVENLVAKFGSTCMGVTVINKLISEITNAYVSRGYITSRVYIPDQDLSTGELVLVTVEGLVEDIRVSTQVEADPKTGQVSAQRLEQALSATESQVNAALATDKGDYLNLRLFEQTIDNLNAVPSTTASLQLVPGEAVGGTIIPISLEYEKPWRASFGANDSGNANTGELNVTGSFEYDNLLNLNDQIRLDYSGSLDTNAVVFTGKLPTGAHSWQLNATYSDYRFIISDITELFGQNASVSLKDEIIIKRDAVDKHWFYGEAAWDGSQRYINGVELTLVKNVVGKLGYKNEMQIAADRFEDFDYEGKLFWDFYVDVDLGKKLGSNIPQDPNPRAVFSQTWSQQLADSLSWTSVVSGQFSAHAQRGARQLSLPGVAAGPGAVDSGITLTQTITAKEPFNWMNGQELGELSLASTLSGGWGQEIGADESKWTVGANFSVTWSHNDWIRTVGYKVPLRASDDNPGEPEASLSVLRNF